MAQIVVDPQVLETKAGTIEEAAKKLSQLYTEMENEVTSTASKMSGRVIDTEVQFFKKFQETFNTFNTDINNFAQELRTVAKSFNNLEVSHVLDYN